MSDVFACQSEGSKGLLVRNVHGSFPVRIHISSISGVIVVVALLAALQASTGSAGTF